MTAQEITYEEARRAARAAYENRTLLAQSPVLIDYGYKRHDRTMERRCAIGAGLSEHTLDELERCGLNFVTIGGYGGDQLTDVLKWRSSEKDALMKLQRAHDKWMEAAQSALLRLGDVHPSELLELENKFRSEIGMPPRELPQ